MSEEAVCTHGSIVQIALFDLALNECGGHGVSRTAVLTGFKYLAGTENRFVPVAPDLFKNLLYHYTAFLWYNRNIKTEEV